jgi:hypothetical protein
LDEYDSARPVIAENSGYVQFWVSLAQAEPGPATTDYKKTPVALPAGDRQGGGRLRGPRD